MSREFWQTREWMEVKQRSIKTQKLLSRVEYVRTFGSANYTEEKYREYSQLMKSFETDTSNSKLKGV